MEGYKSGLSIHRPGTAARRRTAAMCGAQMRN